MRRLTRRQILAAGAVLAVLLTGAALLAVGGREARGSSLSRGPHGWLAARKYLQARGARVRLLDQPLDRFEGGGVLVVTFPWQRGVSPAAGEPLEEHLRRGGDLILAYSGELADPGEIVALEELGLPLREKRKPALHPLRWRRFAREEWDLQPARELKGGAGPVRVWAPRYAPEVPRGARALYRGPGGGPGVSVLERYRGRIWILPADAFANARLGNPGNADLLETLLRRLGDRWTFDEYHHGLVSGRAVETAAVGRALDLVLLHLGVLYLAALLTLARRFGPAWSDPPVVTGSAGSFLLGLGALHHRLRHHAEAARRLLERTRDLDHNLVLPPDFDRRAEGAGPRELVALAREVARLRAGRPAAEENSETERETAA